MGNFCYLKHSLSFQTLNDTDQIWSSSFLQLQITNSMKSEWALQQKLQFREVLLIIIRCTNWRLQKQGFFLSNLLNYFVQWIRIRGVYQVTITFVLLSCLWEMEWICKFWIHVYSFLGAALSCHLPIFEEEGTT